MTPTFVMVMKSGEGAALLPDATGQRRGLEVRPGRAGIPHRHRHRAVPHTPIGLDLAVRAARRRSRLFHGPIERGIA